MTRISDYDYVLPESAIAQSPAEPRDSSRLLVLDKKSGALRHDRFSNIGSYLRERDLLVLNDTRVTALRLLGKRETGGSVEALLLEPLGDGSYRALMKPGRRLQTGTRVDFGGEHAHIGDVFDSGERELIFESTDGLEARLEKIGTTPLPPYITTPIPDAERYQTVYWKTSGSSAAPTAGLHFTSELIAKLKAEGIGIAQVTLAVGIDTFRPVQVDEIADHKMHGERYNIPNETAQAIANARGRIIAVGTTSARTLETAALGRRQVKPGAGCSSLFISPGYEFKIADGILTNFHMPRTTMLCMIAAICGRERLLQAYHEALEEGYRFLSFGDSMLVIGENQ